MTLRIYIIEMEALVKVDEMTLLRSNWGNKLKLKVDALLGQQSKQVSEIASSAIEAAAGQC